MCLSMALNLNSLWCDDVTWYFVITYCRPQYALDKVLKQSVSLIECVNYYSTSAKVCALCVLSSVILVSFVS